MDLAQEEPLDAIDRAVRRAVQATWTWHEALLREPFVSTVVGEAPLSRHRSVAGQQAFQALTERSLLPHDTALRDALRRWVGALTVLRVTEGERAEVARVETDPSAWVRLEKAEKTSFRAAWRGLAASGSAAEGDAWVSAVAEHGEAVLAARREQAANEEEVVRRLGFASYSAMVGGAAPDALDAAAETFLRETRDLSLSLRRADERKGDARAGTFVGCVRSATAQEAPEGWPARLTLRTVVETLGAPADIGKGLPVQATMPTAVGAASFARALEAFGLAYRRAAASTSTLPFAIAVDPSFVDAHRFGFAFGTLPTTTAYQRRGLGVVARVAAQQARVLSRSALLHARHVALASLLSRNAARPDRGRFQELSHEVYGEGVPGSLVGAFPRARGDEAPRLEALMTTLTFLRDLRDQYEEDWFRNPQAWRFLRARASGPARSEGEETLAPVPLARAFEEALG